MKNTLETIEMPKPKAWVIFSGQADLPWLKILKPGFRHCAVVLNDGERWVTIDPLSNYTDVTVHKVPVDFDLPAWMRGRGHTVVNADVTHINKAAPLALYSCVEAVKRVLGIHKRRIFTPWQLYTHLAKAQNLKTFNSDNPKGDFAWEA